MSVTLSPISPRYAVSDADDPFKKYWWVILLGIAFTGVWLLMPMLGEKSVGSDSYQVAQPKAEASVEQSLSSADAGSGIDLSMEGTGHTRQEDGATGSSLYVAPDEPAPEAAAAAVAAAAAPAAGGTSDSLASALKKVSEGTGWNEKAHKGFNAPKLAGGSLSGMSAAGGGKAGAATSGLGAFGSRNANVGFSATQGLSGSVKEQQAPRASGLSALKASAGLATDAARNSSNDGARSGLSQTFDGGKAGSKIGGGGSGAALAGGYAALDTAPINLKQDDPKLNSKELKPPEPSMTDVGESAADDSALAQQLAMMVVGGVVGGMIGGPFGGIVTNAIMKAVENQQQRTEKKETEMVDRHKQISTGK
jgi:hypothetical protein